MQCNYMHVAGYIAIGLSIQLLMRNHENLVITITMLETMKEPFCDVFLRKACMSVAAAI